MVGSKMSFTLHLYANKMHLIILVLNYYYINIDQLYNKVTM